MTNKEINDFFEELKIRYPKSEISEQLIELWATRFSEYDYIDVKENFDDLISTGNYDYNFPQLEVILKGLVKKYKKVDYSKSRFYCQFCKRPFNSLEEMHNHEDRCRSINYIENKSKKYNWDFSNQIKAQLYKMADNEFDKFYNNFLRTMQKTTNMEWEKELIENIFYPPIEREAKRFLNSKMERND